MQQIEPEMESANSYNADELGQYRAISSSAVLALLLAFVSPMAFFSPIFLMVPLVAVVVAYVALSRTCAPDSGLSGTGIARVGLALAIIFGVTAGTRIVVINVLVNRQIEEQHLEEQVDESPLKQGVSDFSRLETSVLHSSGMNG